MMGDGWLKIIGGFRYIYKVSVCVMKILKMTIFVIVDNWMMIVWIVLVIIRNRPRQLELEKANGFW